MFLLIVSVLPTCTGEAPSIRSVRYYTIATYNPETDERSEALSLFLDVSHEDGEELLDELSLSQDDSQLDWTLSADSWQRRRWDGRTWIGSSYLLPPDGESIPRGTYSLRIVDRGGRESISEFELRTLDFELSDAVFPELVRSDASDGESPGWMVEHSGDRVLATLVDDAGDVLARSEIDSGELDLGDFDSAERAEREGAAVFLHELRQRSEVWLVSGPWPI